MTDGSLDPLRICLRNFLQFISNVSSEARNMQLADIAAGKVTQHITVIMDDAPIEGPSAQGIEIYFPKTFLYLLWAVCYYAFVVTEDIMQQELLGSYRGFVRTTPFTQKAYGIINYALNLRNQYIPWPSLMLNPLLQEQYSRDVDVIFGYAMAYIYFHEYAHIKNGHSRNVADDISIEQEREADQFALETIVGPLDDDAKQRDYGIGIGCAGLAMLYAVHSPRHLSQRRHPDVDVRLSNSLEYLCIHGNEPKYYLYKLMCVGLTGFCDSYKIPIPKGEYETVEEQYEYLVDLIANAKLSQA